MIKNVSKADVAFIKRSLRFTKKNKELNDKDTNRMNYLLENLDKDESHDVFAYIYEILQKNMFS
jgi:hypothetical protein|tara:strand:- start:486 stop:677 length:192 start_codon:yes stop_codon:yes gene_type:complete